MGSSLDEKKAYKEFEEKVQRTVYLEYLSPKVTIQVIQKALGQFGNVLNVEFVPNYTIPYPMPQSALVEMETAKQARDTVNELNTYPFMMSGMPRPAKARRAKIEMFVDRPAPPDRKIKMRWVDKNSPDFEVANNLKKMYKKHNTEHLTLLKLQVEAEEKLAEQQSEMLTSNYKKYEMIQNSVHNGSAATLAHHYGIKFTDDLYLS